jgi:hypothetical protein
VLVTISKQDDHTATLMGLDTVKLVEMQGVSPRLENNAQSRQEANIWGFKAEFAVARLFDIEPPTVNVVTDNGVDLWMDDISIDVKFSNKERGPLIFDTADKFKADVAVLVGRTDKDRTLRVNGWVSKQTFVDHAVAHDFGYGERLKMDVSDIDPIEVLWRKMMARKFRRVV